MEWPRGSGWVSLGLALGLIGAWLLLVDESKPLGKTALGRWARIAYTAPQRGRGMVPTDNGRQVGWLAIVFGAAAVGQGVKAYRDGDGASF